MEGVGPLYVARSRALQLGLNVTISGAVTPTVVVANGLALRLSLSCYLGVPLDSVTLTEVTTTAQGVAGLTLAPDSVPNALTGNCSDSSVEAPSSSSSSPDNTTTTAFVTIRCCRGSGAWGVDPQIGDLFSNLSSPSTAGRVLAPFVSAVASSAGLASSALLPTVGLGSAAPPAMSPPASPPASGAATAGTAPFPTAAVAGASVGGLVLLLCCCLLLGCVILRRRKQQKAAARKAASDRGNFDDPSGTAPRQPRASATAVAAGGITISGSNPMKGGHAEGAAKPAHPWPQHKDFMNTAVGATLGAFAPSNRLHRPKGSAATTAAVAGSPLPLRGPTRKSDVKRPSRSSTTKPRTEFAQVC